MNKKVIWGILIVIILVAVILFAPNTPTEKNDEAEVDLEDNATTTEPTEQDADEANQEPSEDLGEDATSSINEQLEGINVDDLEDEFNEIDEDLQNL
ncbi:MAG TPA: hypothetical protein VKO61_01165 [Candidatus Paceibacterota bacterium]|nr:hypothetical protein [Candidatus Paceibacterota bacterium]